MMWALKVSRSMMAAQRRGSVKVAAHSENDLKGMNIDITAQGDDGFTLSGTNSMGLISRDIEDLFSATIGRHHQDPDGMVLFTGTMFALTQDRDTSGKASPTEWGTS
jgi:fumarylacetoacetate (FAA) hydrolase family protein